MRLRLPPFPSRYHWAIAAFLLGFAIFLLILSHTYLLPAFDALRTATPDEKKRIAAYSRLLLAVILVILGAGIILTFRIGRYFLPRHRPPRTRTEYTDAWAESARRMPQPPPER
jgi:uncharacterized BrkB/YihY/UPF0761 family membrane protein